MCLCFSTSLGSRTFHTLWKCWDRRSAVWLASSPTSTSLLATWRARLWDICCPIGTHSHSASPSYTFPFSFLFLFIPSRRDFCMAQNDLKKDERSYCNFQKRQNPNWWRPTLTILSRNCKKLPKKRQTHLVTISNFPLLTYFGIVEWVWWLSMSE